MKRWFFLIAVMASCLWTSAVQAGHLILDYGIHLVGTVGGTPLNGHVTFRGVFDTANATTVRPDFVSYSFDSLEIGIEGLGKFFAATPGNFDAILGDPATFSFPAIGVADSALDGGYLFSGFTATSHPVNPFAPTSAEYLGHFGDGFSLPMTIPLAGGVGDLVITGEAGGSSALLSPEPSAILLALCGFTTLCAVRLYKRHRSGDADVLLFSGTLTGAKR
jgi:hypothetical protein